MVASRRLRAVAALTGGVVVVGAPSLSARLTGTRVPLREVVRGELAGSGSALLRVTGGDRQMLATHRRLVLPVTRDDHVGDVGIDHRFGLNDVGDDDGGWSWWRRDGRRVAGMVGLSPDSGHGGAVTGRWIS